MVDVWYNCLFMLYVFSVFILFVGMNLVLFEGLDEYLFLDILIKVNYCCILVVLLLVEDFIFVMVFLELF